MALRKPIFVVPLDLGTVVCGNARYGNPVFNLAEFKAAGLTWRTDGNGNLWARGKFATEQSIDFCSMIEANAQAGTTIRLRLGDTQAEVDGTAPYDSGNLTFIDPAISQEDGLYHSHLEIGSVQTALWWRIDIGGHTGDFEASCLILGKQIVPDHCYNPDFERGVEDLGDMSYGRWGVPDETPGAILRTLSLTIGWINEAEYEASFRPMAEKIGRRGAVYCCYNPEATAYRQGKTYLGTMRKPLFARGVPKPSTYAMDFEILSII